MKTGLFVLGALVWFAIRKLLRGWWLLHLCCFLLIVLCSHEYLCALSFLCLLSFLTFPFPTLQQYRKALDETPFNNQLGLLLAKKDAALPLYLKVACEEVRVHAVFEQLTAFLQVSAKSRRS